MELKKINHVREVVIHIVPVESNHTNALSNQVNQFHVDVIERKLHQMSLTTEQKIIVIDKIIENLKLQQLHIAE